MTIFEQENKKPVITIFEFKVIYPPCSFMHYSVKMCCYKSAATLFKTLESPLYHWCIRVPDTLIMA